MEGSLTFLGAGPTCPGAVGVSEAEGGGRGGCGEGDTWAPVACCPSSRTVAASLLHCLLLTELSCRSNSKFQDAAGIRKSENDLSRDRGEAGLSPEPLNLNSRQALVLHPRPPWGPHLTGGHGRGGVEWGGHWGPELPASLTHSATGPPPLWGQASLGQLEEEGGDTGRGGRGRRDVPGEHLQPDGLSSSDRDHCQLSPLSGGISSGDSLVGLSPHPGGLDTASREIRSGLSGLIGPQLVSEACWGVSLCPQLTPLPIRNPS